MYLRICKTIFLSVKTWLTFSHSNVLIHTSVETSTVIIKSGFCAKIVILESVSFFFISICYKKQQEFPEDGVDKRRNASELINP